MAQKEFLLLEREQNIDKNLKSDAKFYKVKKKKKLPTAYLLCRNVAWLFFLGNWTRKKIFIKLLDPAPDPDTRKMKADPQPGICTPNLNI